jgi:hypothetical protein
MEARFTSFYEACYWIIEAPDYTYLDTSKISIWIDHRTVKGSFYVYEGTDRHNSTAVIESNLTAVAGAPYSVPVGSKLIVVFMTQNDGYSGSGAFSW